MPLEPGVSLCFRGFRGARRNIEHCGLCADACSMLGNKVEEETPRLTKHGLPLLTLGQLSCLSPKPACPPYSSGLWNHAVIPRRKISVLLSTCTSAHTHTPCPRISGHLPVPLPRQCSCASPFPSTAASLLCVHILPARATSRDSQ